ncbi:hypothetical protein [Aquirhabdus sp.]|uniref:hypothetical protein n=1 Tax=Aquirhabdus sp. TaxID=2824160 RepID=UPI00396C9161
MPTAHNSTTATWEEIFERSTNFGQSLDRSTANGKSSSNLATTAAITASDFTVKNATATDIANLNTSLAYLETSATASSIITGLKSKSVKISIIHDGNDRYSSSTNTIYWDPNSALTVQDNATGKAVGVQSAALGLIHEGAHATDANLALHASTYNAQYDDDAEAYAVGKEDIIAGDLGETKRYNHGGVNLPYEANPTEHSTPKGDGTYTYAAWINGAIVKGGVYTLGSAPSTLPAITAARSNTTTSSVDQLISALGSFAPASAATQSLFAANDAHAAPLLAYAR